MPLIMDMTWLVILGIVVAALAANHLYGMWRRMPVIDYAQAIMPALSLPRSDYYERVTPAPVPVRSEYYARRARAIRTLTASEDPLSWRPAEPANATTRAA
jgi:hypothetical protein